MKYIFYLFILAFIITACDDKRIEDVNTSINDHTPYIQKDWKLVNVVQIDEKAGPGKLKTLDISSAVLNGDVSSLSFDGQNFTATGVLEQSLGSSGDWSFDDNFFPTEIRFVSTNITQNITLGQSITSFSQDLKLKAKQTYCTDGSESTSYEYVFEQN